MQHNEYQIGFTKRAGHPVTLQKVYYSILKFTMIVNCAVKCDRHFSVYFGKLYYQFSLHSRI